MNNQTFSAGRTGRRLVGFMATGLALLLVGALPAMAAASNAMAAPATAQTQADKTKLQAMTVAQLLAAARDAYSHGRVVAPASDNAVEYYLAVLGKDPGNRVATDALRESFPYAAAKVEKTIAQDSFDEANREIGLLARAAPDNYTLTILRTKLDAQQKLPGRQHVLTLQASGKSWIRVTTARGRVIDSRILHPGDSRTYRSVHPLRITLGNAEGVKVTSDGKTVRVKARPNARVAHLELFAAL